MRTVTGYDIELPAEGRSLADVAPSIIHTKWFMIRRCLLGGYQDSAMETVPCSTVKVPKQQMTMTNPRTLQYTEITRINGRFLPSIELKAYTLER